MKKFQPAKTKPGKTPRSSRRAGLMYFDCPEHGRFGFDGKKEMQEYIVCHGNIKGAAELAPETTPPASSEPAAKVRQEPKPEAKPTPAAPTKRKGFGFFD